jgi:hypothetical protein
MICEKTLAVSGPSLAGLFISSAGFTTDAIVYQHATILEKTYAGGTP